MLRFVEGSFASHSSPPDSQFAYETTIPFRLKNSSLRLICCSSASTDRQKTDPTSCRQGLIDHRHGICFNSDLQRQFEFVQQTWINNPVFGGLNGEVDPLIGDQGSCSGMMTIQADPLRSRVKNMCGFVTTRGGAYAFLPTAGTTVDRGRLITRRQCVEP